MSCSMAYYQLQKRQRSHLLSTDRQKGSRRLQTHRRRSIQISTPIRDNNFVRCSLQMQSREFEQLCEFIMRVNPLYDSSEGWKESSNDESLEEASSRKGETTRQHNRTRKENSRVKPIVRHLAKHAAEFDSRREIGFF